MNWIIVALIVYAAIVSIMCVAMTIAWEDEVKDHEQIEPIDLWESKKHDRD